MRSKKKKFKRIVKYVESKRTPLGFGVKDRTGKITMIIFFIMAFPLVCLITGIKEFIDLCSVERREHWEEIR